MIRLKRHSYVRCDQFQGESNDASIRTILMELREL
jgi:hypothetical protein